MTPPTVTDMMVAYAEDAVEVARAKVGVSLDYTVESVEEVEAIAEQLMQAARPKGLFGRLFHKGPSEHEMQTVCKMLGGYVGEVMRRNGGGQWEINEQCEAIGCRRGDSVVLPPAKVHTRLANGSEDNLWHYVNVLLKEP